MATPCRFAASTTSSSRTDPPGCMTASTPAPASASTPSAKGKNASLAATAPRTPFPAFFTAVSEESTRLICPAPTPTVAPSLTSTMALLFTVRATRQAKRRSDVCSGAGRLGHGGANRGAARVGVLDDHGGPGFEARQVRQQRPGGVEIVEVVEGDLPPLQLLDA